jgi:hypothetical protein
MVWTGAVDERVNPAPFLVHSLHKASCGDGIRNIALHCQTICAVMFHGGNNFPRLLRAGAVTNCYRPASRSQIQRDGAPDAASATRDQSDFVHRKSHLLVC